MVKTPKKPTVAETVAETAAKVMRKGRSKNKSAKEPENEGEEDPEISETESSDEEWDITAFKYRKGLPKLAAEIGMDGTEDYLAILDHIQGMKDGIERHQNSVGARSNLWEMCMTPTFGDTIKEVGKADQDVLEGAEELLFEEASPAKLRLLKEFAAMVREAFEENKDYTALIRGVASGAVMLNLVRAQHLRSSVDGQLQTEEMTEKLKDLRLRRSMTLREFFRQFDNLVRIIDDIADSDLTDKYKCVRITNCIRLSMAELRKSGGREFSPVVQMLDVNAKSNTLTDVKRHLTMANDTQVNEFKQEKLPGRASEDLQANSAVMKDPDCVHCQSDHQCWTHGKKCPGAETTCSKWGGRFGDDCRTCFPSRVGNSNSNKSRRTKRQPSKSSNGDYCRDFQKGKCTRTNCKYPHKEKPGVEANMAQIKAVMKGLVAIAVAEKSKTEGKAPSEANTASLPDNFTDDFPEFFMLDVGEDSKTHETGMRQAVDMLESSLPEESSTAVEDLRDLIDEVFEESDDELDASQSSEDESDDSGDDPILQELAAKLARLELERKERKVEAERVAEVKRKAERKKMKSEKAEEKKKELAEKVKLLEKEAELEREADESDQSEEKEDERAEPATPEEELPVTPAITARTSLQRKGTPRTVKAMEQIGILERLLPKMNTDKLKLVTKLIKKLPGQVMTRAMMKIIKETPKENRFNTFTNLTDQGESEEDELAAGLPNKVFVFLTKEGRHKMANSLAELKQGVNYPVNWNDARSFENVKVADAWLKDAKKALKLKEGQNTTPAKKRSTIKIKLSKAVKKREVIHTIPMEFDGEDLDDFIELDDAGFDDVSEPIDAKQDKITTESDEEATDEESADEEAKDKSFVLATEPVVGIFGSLDKLMSAVKKTSTRKTMTTAMKRARYQRFPSMEQALGAMTIVDQEFVFTELNDYSLAPRHNTSSMDAVWGRIKEFSILAMVVILVGLLANVALSPGPMSLPGTHAMHGRIPGEEDVSPGNMTRWINTNGVVTENENRLIDDQTAQNPYALPAASEPISPSPPSNDENEPNQTTYTTQPGMITQPGTQCYEHGNTTPPVQQHTAAPQPPTALESALAHDWFDENFLISAVEADIRAAQQHMYREENDLTPRPLTNQQRNNHGRPASPEQQLTPKQCDTNVEPNGVFFRNEDE